MNSPRSSYQALEIANKIRQIRFMNGHWWLTDSEQDRKTRLDPEFLSCHWCVDSLSKKLGIGNRTFSRLIEESLGITGKRWLCQIRINVAWYLLRQGSKVEVVAIEPGFSSASNFAREFKKQIGVSPSHFVKTEFARSIEFQKER
jgi:AraC-like DNA-binding protein